MTFIMKKNNKRVAILIADSNKVAISMAKGIIDGIRNSEKKNGIPIHDVSTKENFTLTKILNNL